MLPINGMVFSWKGMETEHVHWSDGSRLLVHVTDAREWVLRQRNKRVHPTGPGSGRHSCNRMCVIPCMTLSRCYDESVLASLEYRLESEGRKNMFYLTTHSTHFIYGYVASDIWQRTILIVREETRCSHIGYSFRLTARVLLYAPSHRQDSTYHGLCYTSRVALAGTRNS